MTSSIACNVQEAGGLMSLAFRRPRDPLQRSHYLCPLMTGIQMPSGRAECASRHLYLCCPEHGNSRTPAKYRASYPLLLSIDHPVSSATGRNPVQAPRWWLALALWPHGAVEAGQGPSPSATTSTVVAESTLHPDIQRSPSSSHKTRTLAPHLLTPEL